MSEAENREQDWTPVGVGVWGSRGLRSLQSRRILQRDPWLFFFRNDVSPPSWTLILPESWDESKTDIKGEVDGCEIEEREGRKKYKKYFLFSPPCPPPRFPPLLPWSFPGELSKAMLRLWAPIRAKQLSMAATARVIWRVHAWGTGQALGLG